MGVAAPPVVEGFKVSFLVRGGLAERMLDRMLDRYALPLKESGPVAEELWPGAAVVEEEEPPLTWLELWGDCV